jgi:NitT/TauT family transport system permease protein
MLVLAIFVIIIDTLVSAVENRLMVWRPQPAAAQG